MKITLTERLSVVILEIAFALARHRLQNVLKHF